jgi:hypothetical protein
MCKAFSFVYGAIAVICGVGVFANLNNWGWLDAGDKTILVVLAVFILVWGFEKVSTNYKLST